VRGRDRVRRPRNVLADGRVSGLDLFEVPGFCVQRHFSLLWVDFIDAVHARGRL
jgi:hypothetical protein